MITKDNSFELWFSTCQKNEDVQVIKFNLCSFISAELFQSEVPPIGTDAYASHWIFKHFLLVFETYNLLFQI